MITNLPDPYFPRDAFLDCYPVGSGADVGTGAIVASGNRAVYVPVWFPSDATLYSLMFRASNGTGNYDLGLYNASLALMASTGSTAMSAAGTKTLSLPNVRVKAGELFFAALALSSSSGQGIRYQNSALGWGSAGVGHENSAFPLPSTATPVIAVETVIPVFSFGVR